MRSTDSLRDRLARPVRWGRLASTLGTDPRVRVGVAGFSIGFLAVPALVIVAGWSPRAAANTTFALGALVLGFAVLAWVAAVMTGPAVESVQDYLDFADGWTEAEARLAFGVLVALGAGVMVGSSVATVVV